MSDRRVHVERKWSTEEGGAAVAGCHPVHVTSVGVHQGKRLHSASAA